MSFPRPRVSREFMVELEKGLADFKYKKGVYRVTMPEYTKQLVKKKREKKNNEFEFTI